MDSYNTIAAQEWVRWKGKPRAKLFRKMRNRQKEIPCCGVVRSPQQLPAIEHEHAAGHEAAGFAGEIDGEGADFVRVAPAGDRVAVRQCARLAFAPVRDSLKAMSTLTEIESAIGHLPPPEVEELAVWLEQRRLRKTTTAITAEPDFLARAKAIWGEQPAGKPLSALVSESRS
jgi:hypothetical protein